MVIEGLVGVHLTITVWRVRRKVPTVCCEDQQHCFHHELGEFVVSSRDGVGYNVFMHIPRNSIHTTIFTVEVMVFVTLFHGIGEVQGQ